MLELLKFFTKKPKTANNNISFFRKTEITDHEHKKHARLSVKHCQRPLGTRPAYLLQTIFALNRYSNTTMMTSVRSLHPSNLNKFNNIIPVNTNYFLHTIKKIQISKDKISAIDPTNYILWCISIFLLLIAYLNKDNFAKNNEDLKYSVENCINSFLNGDIDNFILQIIDLGTRNNKIKEILFAIENGNKEKAEPLLENFLINHLNLPEMFYLLKGIIANAEGKHDLAIWSLTRALKSNSTYTRNNIMYHLGFSYHLKNLTTKSEMYLQESTFDESRILKWKNLYEYLGGLLCIYPIRINGLGQKMKELQDLNARLQHNNENKVIIRAWFPRTLKDKGHVSIQTNKHYISYWPASNPDTDTLYYSLFGRPAKLNTLWEDFKDMLYLPDVRVYLDLNVNEINIAYEEFRRSKCNWALLGSLFESSENCSSLAYYLLAKGGMNTTRPLISGERDPFIPPHDLADLVLKAYISQKQEHVNKQGHRI